jgi:hypothetical protein
MKCCYPCKQLNRIAYEVYCSIEQPIFMPLSTMVTMGGDIQPGSLADRLLTGLGQPQINP